MKFFSIFKLFLFVCIGASSCAIQIKNPSYCPPPKKYASKASAKIINEAKDILRAGSEKRAISFGIFGNNAKYTEGLIRNAKVAKEVFPGWTLVVYAHSETVPTEVITELRALGAVILLSKDFNHAAARFFIADRPEYDRFIVRDADSRLMHRDAAAVADWIKEDWAILHGMRDTVAHTDPLLGGMWGARSKPFRDILQKEYGTPSLEKLYKEYMDKKNRGVIYGDDQHFLADIVLKAVGEDRFLCHETILCSAYKHSIGFPITRSLTGPFIGQVIEL